MSSKVNCADVNVLSASRQYLMQPIGLIRSCYVDKFGVPRQPGLIKNAKARLDLINEFNHEDYIKGLEAFSHIWLIFDFHRIDSKHTIKRRPTVRPPRLGGNERVGVFASRSTFRPNGMGLSVVQLDKIDTRTIQSSKGPTKQVSLFLSGVDIIDGTPILDIKPYLPYSDSIVDAKSGYVSGPPETVFEVKWTDIAKEQLEDISRSTSELQNRDELIQLINETIAFDPRPAYRKNKSDEKEYKLRIYDLEISWSVENSLAYVLDLKNIFDLRD